MSKYYATYKCPLCGTMIRCGDPQEIPYDQLPVLLEKIVSNHQQFYGHPVLYRSPLYIPHKCPNGDAGLAAFSGFTKIDKMFSSNQVLQISGSINHIDELYAALKFGLEYSGNLSLFTRK